MEPKRRREIALAAAAALLVVATAYLLLFRSSSSDAAVRPRSAAAVVAQAKQQSKGQVAEVDLGALKNPRVEPVDTDRNPFRFKPKPPPPPPPPPPRPVTTTTPEVTQPVGPPPPPRIALKFFGKLETKNGLTAALSDGRGVYYGRQGDTIEGRYRILRIGVESIDLAYLDGRGRQTIPFTGQ